MGGHASARHFGLPWWFHLAQKARRSETARRPCPGHDISQVLEILGLAPRFSLTRCLVLFRVQPSKEKSPVAGLFAGHLASSRTRSAIRSHLCTRTVVLRYAARIMRPRKRCGRGAQRDRSPQSEGAQISHDTCLHGRSPFKCVVKAEECGAVQPQPHPEVRPYPRSSWQLPATCQS